MFYVVIDNSYFELIFTAKEKFFFSGIFNSDTFFGIGIINSAAFFGVGIINSDTFFGIAFSYQGAKETSQIQRYNGVSIIDK